MTKEKKEFQISTTQLKIFKANVKIIPYDFMHNILCLIKIVDPIVPIDSINSFD